MAFSMSRFIFGLPGGTGAGFRFRASSEDGVGADGEAESDIFISVQESSRRVGDGVGAGLEF